MGLISEYQGGNIAPTGNYLPMANDAWSLDIVLLNLTTGHNPWKSTTLGGPHSKPTYVIR